MAVMKPMPVFAPVMRTVRPDWGGRVGGQLAIAGGYATGAAPGRRAQSFAAASIVTLTP